MLWALVWTTLVVGSLVGAFFLVRDVLRRSGRLVRALEEAGVVLERLDAKIAELDTARTEAEPYASDRASALARLAELRAVREDRAAARRARRAATIASWRELTR